MKYAVIAFMVMGCSAVADTHHGKMTRQEVGRLLDKQIANYDGRYDEDLNKEVEKAFKQNEGK